MNFRNVVFLLFIFLLNCQNETKILTSEISALEATINEQPSQENLQKLLDLYLRMQHQTQGSEMLTYQWKAAETARAVRNFSLADSLLTSLTSQKDNNDLASKALFLQAFMYDEDLDDIQKARGLYERFIKDYPGHDFVDDAQFLLDNLGKSEQEMLETLQQLREQNEEKKQ